MKNPTLLQQFKRDCLLKEWTTFAVGGPADYLIEVHDIPTMQTVLSFCHQSHLRYFILGKGSNILFDDRGFAGLIIVNRIQFLEQLEPHEWHVGAGYSFSLLGTQTARQGWSGLEFACGIPGTVGGAVFMNAGANGRETSHTLVSVDFVSSTGELFSFSKEELSFDYRSSSFQKHKGAIVGATFSLSQGAQARQDQLNILDYRKKTQPYNAKSAGCMFRNPPTHRAGALIEQSGLKGKTWGGAQVSTVHANFIINTGTATSTDIFNLTRFIQQEVKAKTNVDLEREVNYIPHGRTVDG